MNLPRFFYPHPIHLHEKLTVPRELAHYLTRVLRLADQSAATFFNGEGGEFEVSLQIESKNVYATAHQFHAIERELPWAISIAQGLATGDKMDWVCEKSGEMGAAHLYPIAAKFSTLKLQGERLEKRLQHWQRIAQSASEQCGRNRVLRVHHQQTVSQFFEQVPVDSQVLFCDPDASLHFPDAIDQAQQKNQHHWVLLIGPEGGWSQEEKHIALKHGAIAMRFGARVLRTETAAIALIGAIRGQLRWVD